MKIIYDHQIFSHQIYGGISRCFVELFKQLNRTNDLEFYLPILYSNNTYLSEIPEIRSKKNDVLFCIQRESKIY